MGRNRVCKECAGGGRCANHPECLIPRSGPSKKVTDATKAKLPLPKGHPQKRQAKRKRCPNCEKMVLVGPHDIHTCYDAKALRESLDQKISALQALEDSAFPPTEDAPDFRTELVAWNDPSEPFESEYARARVLQARLDARRFMPESVTATGYREPLYDTRPIPWSWETPTLSIRRWLSNKLTALAKWVAP